MIGLKKNEVVLSSPEPEQWKEEFKKERQKLEVVLKGKYIAIEHIGSTAILGIVAKPIIDIAVGVKDFNNIDSIKSILIMSGYEYRPNNGSDDRVVFIKFAKSKSTHHVHIEQYGEKSWYNHINFRDCLLQNPDLQAEYMALKIMLAQKYPGDRNKYTEGKAEFILRVLSSK